ncbi:MAG: long-chain fatty acid--CoA ligase [Deltaproteobacteria bacterium]|nr:long-chain fatty acid--CoA ligase [Deltaproteobacteria bacterium]
MESRFWVKSYDYHVPNTLRYPKLIVPELLNGPVSTYPDKAAINFFGSTITYWQLKQQVLRFANALAELGVEKGERVGVQLPTCPQYVIAYYAILSRGAIVVNMNPLYTPDEIKGIIAETGMTSLITFDTVLPNIRAVCQSVDLKRVIVTAMTDFIEGLPKATAQSLQLEKGWHHYSTLLDNCSNTKRSRVLVLPDDPAVLQFTGGTTGTPKGATLTHANIIAATIQAAVWGSSTDTLQPPDRRVVMGIMPLFHVYGNICVMNYALIKCATQILVPRFNADELMDIISKVEYISFFPCVPTIISAMINHPKAQEINLAKKIGLFNSGAAPIPTEMIDQVKDMGILFTEGWGMSETTSLGISNPIFGAKKQGSIGVPFPDMDVKLVDVEEGKNEVKLGEPGEIVIKGPLVMKGYWNRPKETEEQLVDGWLYTGDVAVQDEDGYISIVDRKKDMVIAGGYNIYPREIDEVLFQHPKIADAVAVGLTDEYRGETIKAYVVLKEGQSATEEEIIKFCKEKLAIYKAPKSVEFRTSLPKSAVGKILRKVLRAEEEEKKKTKK